MNRSEQIGELIAALAKAQLEFSAATKDSDNPFYNSKYADLSSVTKAIRPALNRQGIALINLLETDLERQVAIATVGLYHGEQFISTTVEAPAVGKGKDGMPKFDVQTIGSAWRYMRRYVSEAISGLAVEDPDDDDGNSIQGNHPVQSRTSQKPVQPRAPQGAQPPTTTPKSSPEPVEAGNFNLVGELMECVIKGVTDKETKGKKAYVVATFNGRIDGFNYAANWHQSLTPALKAAIGKPCIIKISRKMSEDGKSIQFLNIEDVLYVDGVDYEGGQPKPKSEAPVEVTNADIPF